jgi:hypothetical protein
MRRLFALALLFAGLSSMSFASFAQELWQGTRLGMTESDVKALFPKAHPPAKQTPNGQTQRLMLDGVLLADKPFTAEFVFAAGKLESVELTCPANTSGGKGIFDRLFAGLEKKYGKAATHLVHEDGVIDARWLTESTDIYLFFWQLGDQAALSIKYTGGGLRKTVDKL